MTPEQFKPIAEHHGLSIPWLAEKVAKVSERTFRYWVNGRPGINTKVPNDVVLRIKKLNRVLGKLRTQWLLEDHLNAQVKALSKAIDDDIYKQVKSELKCK